MRVFRGKSAIVTGGASGIGRAVSEALASEGAVVTVADRDGPGAEAVAHGIRARGGQAKGCPLDVRDAAAVAALVDGFAAEHGRLDYLFNNAGIVVGGEERYVSLEDWNQVLDVDLRGTVHGVRAAYPIMVRQGSGHIVNTASIAGLVPTSMNLSYAAAKYGIVGLSHGLRIEGARLGVKVSVVCPGFIDTPLYQTAEMRGPLDMQQLLGLFPTRMPAERCAHVILDGVARNRSTILVTAEAKLMWAIQRISPEAGLWLATQFLERVRKMAREAETSTAGATTSTRGA
jgi:NAD(P)-dependent dehydrogenase (short-subunit alcohol dehydrogenase family)